MAWGHGVGVGWGLLYCSGRRVGRWTVILVVLFASCLCLRPVARAAARGVWCVREEGFRHAACSISIGISGMITGPGRRSG